MHDIGKDEVVGLLNHKLRARVKLVNFLHHNFLDLLLPLTNCLLIARSNQIVPQALNLQDRDDHQLDRVEHHERQTDSQRCDLVVEYDAGDSICAVVAIVEDIVHHYWDDDCVDPRSRRGFVQLRDDFLCVSMVVFVL